MNTGISRRPAVNMILSRQLLSSEEKIACMFCMTHMIEVNSPVLVLWMGDAQPPQELPIGTLAIYYYCRRCKRNYNLYYQA